MLPNFDIILDSLLLPAPESRDVLELHLLFIYAVM